MLAELDEVYGQKKLNDKQYSVFKDQIIKFRQAHTSKAKKSTPSSIQRQDSDEKTEILAAWRNYERIYENFKLD